MPPKKNLTVTLMFTLMAAGEATAADTTDRTVMPDFCSRRDVNCVLPDNAGSGVVGTPTIPAQAVTATQTTPPRAGFTQPGSSATTTTGTTGSSTTGSESTATATTGGTATISGGSITTSGTSAAGTTTFSGNAGFGRGR